MKKGFTLIEILIVVVIIAILASLIVPRMSAQTARAQASEVFNVLGAMKRAIERHFELTRTFPAKSATGDVWVELDANGPSASFDDPSLLGLSSDLRAPKDYTVDCYTSWDSASNWGMVQIDIFTFDGSQEIYYNTDSDTYPNGTWTCIGTLFRNQVEGDTSTPCVTI